jgi:capsular polysaccharide biosynthesis protein
METQLARLGFVTVKLEELSTFEQIAIFQGARIVVAESGAALTNIIFMRQKSRVLEIHPGNDQAGLWGSLANVFNVGLEVIYGKKNRIRNLFFGLGSYRLSMRELELKLDDLVRNL